MLCRKEPSNNRRGVGSTIPHPVKIAEDGAASIKLRARKTKTLRWARPPEKTSEINYY